MPAASPHPGTPAETVSGPSRPRSDPDTSPRCNPSRTATTPSPPNSKPARRSNAPVPSSAPVPRRYYRRHRGLGVPGFNAQALEQGQRPRQEIREVARIPAPAEVATRLDVGEGSDVIVRRLTFWLEDMPVALHDGYFPADLVTGTAIEQPRRIRGGAHAVIEDPEGSIRRHIARSVDEISGRMPTPEEARELVLPPGVPVFRVLRTVYDTEGRPLEVQDSVAAADRHRFRYEVEMR